MIISPPPMFMRSMKDVGSSVASRLEALTCNPEAPGSSLLSDIQMDLFTVVQGSLSPVGVFNNVYYSL